MNIKLTGCGNAEARSRQRKGMFGNNLSHTMLLLSPKINMRHPSLSLSLSHSVTLAHMPRAELWLCRAELPKISFELLLTQTTNSLALLPDIGNLHNLGDKF